MKIKYMERTSNGVVVRVSDGETEADIEFKTSGTWFKGKRIADCTYTDFYKRGMGIVDYIASEIMPQVKSLMKAKTGKEIVAATKKSVQPQNAVAVSDVIGSDTYKTRYRQRRYKLNPDFVGRDDVTLVVYVDDVPTTEFEVESDHVVLPKSPGVGKTVVIEYHKVR